MLQGLLYLLFGLLIIEIIVCTHEAGHYFFARLAGVDVSVVSIGVGMPLHYWTTRKNFVNVRICFPPLAGFCKLKGSFDIVRALKTKSGKFDFSVGSLYSVSPLKRALIYLAGPLFNLALCFVLLFSFHLTPHLDDASPAIVVSLKSQDELLNMKDEYFRTGDEILEINGKKISYFKDAYNILKNSADDKKTITAKIKRHGDIKIIQVSPSLNDEGKYSFFVAKKENLIIQRIDHLKTEYLAGLREGDRIIRANSTEINNTIDFLKEIESSNYINVEVVREDEHVFVEYIPERKDNKVINNFAVSKPNRKVNGDGIKDSAINAVVDIKNSALTSFRLVRDAFCGRIKFSKVFAGPWRAIKSAGEIATVGANISMAEGARTILFTSALFSLSLALINLIPLPGLDGMVMVVSFVELFLKKKLLPLKFYRIWHIVGRIMTALFTFILMINF